ncbi:MAG TPA: serine/threonine-protein kinase, partial [Bryobacteraceae bacterium]|nr:serine/threonine-protein kinase [Bryobacteraceae bacterium]
MDTLGGYQILGELGRGGCGVVYAALDPRIGRKVAIKTIDAGAETAQGKALRERFRREARAAGILSHPHIVTIHELNDSSGVLYIVMEFVDGRTLAERMESEPLTPEFIVSMLAAAADALDFAHSHDIVHRDVKPANFLITAAGQLKIADFGIAKVADGDMNLTTTGMVMGTAQYMSPEQVLAKPATGRSDQFSLAVIAYEMLTGQKPFQGDSWASVLHQILNVEPPSVSSYRENLGDGVTAVLRKALAKDPAARYESCRAFVDELAREVLGSAAYAALIQPATQSLGAYTRTISVPQAPASPPVPSKPVSPPVTWIRPVAMGVGAAVLVFGGWLAYRIRSNRPAASAPAAVVAETQRPEAPLPDKQLPQTNSAQTPAPLPGAPPAQNPAAESTPAKTRIAPKSQPAKTAASKANTRPEPSSAPPPAQESSVTAPNQTPQSATPITAPPVQTARKAEPPQTAPVNPAPAAPSRPTEAEAWSRIASTADIAALTQFRQNYPNGAHFAEAAQRIEQIEWDQAQRAGDAASFRSFLLKYPSGALSDHAKAELEKLNRAADLSANRALVTAALDRYRDAFQ